MRAGCGVHGGSDQTVVSSALGGRRREACTPCREWQGVTHLVVHTTYNGTDCGQGLPPEQHVAHVQMPQELLTHNSGEDVA